MPAAAFGQVVLQLALTRLARHYGIGAPARPTRCRVPHPCATGAATAIGRCSRSRESEGRAPPALGLKDPDRGTDPRRTSRPLVSSIRGCSSDPNWRNMLKFVGTQWRGEAPFWMSTLVVSLLLPWALTIFGIQWLSAYTIDGTPYRNMTAGAIVFAMIGAVGIWQLIGTWRASSQTEGAGPMVDHTLARASRRSHGLRAGGVQTPTAPAGMARYYAEATDADVIGQQDHDVTVDGDRIVVTGQLSWGLYDSFSQALRDNDQVQVVVLDSPGGQTNPEWAVAWELIKERGPDTLTTETARKCMELTTYLGGNRRILEQGARLGYHAPLGIRQVSLRRSQRTRPASCARRMSRRISSDASLRHRPTRPVPNRRRVAPGEHRHGCEPEENSPGSKDPARHSADLGSDTPASSGKASGAPVNILDRVQRFPLVVERTSSTSQRPSSRTRSNRISLGSRSR